MTLSLYQPTQWRWTIMLNRRLTDYIFYGILAVITLAIVLLRIAVVGGQSDRIAELKAQNNQLAIDIEQLNELVQDNKSVQTSHLYDLYDTVPNVFSSVSLTYKTVAMLEQLGIDESQDYNRSVIINQNFGAGDSSLSQVAQGYKIVQVDVSFTTDDITLVTDFIDMLYQSEQLFIIDSVNYTETNGEFSQEMNISFLAVYDVDEE